jgi:hypothetical protein
MLLSFESKDSVEKWARYEAEKKPSTNYHFEEAAVGSWYSNSVSILPGYQEKSIRYSPLDRYRFKKGCETAMLIKSLPNFLVICGCNLNMQKTLFCYLSRSSTRFGAVMGSRQTRLKWWLIPAIFSFLYFVIFLFSPTHTSIEPGLGQSKCRGSRFFGMCRAPLGTRIKLSEKKL